MMRYETLERHGRYSIARVSGTQEYTGRAVSPYLSVRYRDHGGAIHGVACGTLENGRAMIRRWAEESGDADAADALRSLDGQDGGS